VNFKHPKLMKNRIFTGVSFLMLLTFAAACTQEKEVPAIDKEAIKSEIQAIENKFASAFNTRNADSITYYAEDAVSYFAGQEPIVGIDAILDHIGGELEEFPEGARITFETKEIYVTDNGDHVAEIGAHTLLDSSGAVIQSGHYFSFFAKRDGRYVCTRDMANSVGAMDRDSL
jgi:ketosteroid isomerase-like protein